MDWSNESYVRLYVRDTKTWLRLGWEGQVVLTLTLRKLDRAGLLDDVSTADDLAVMLGNGIPVPIVEVGLTRLLEREVFALVPSGLLMPHFIEAQEARKSDPQRQRDSREKKRAMSRNVTAESRNVTSATENRSPASHSVTTCHTRSQPVTLTSALLCSALPCSADQMKCQGKDLSESARPACDMSAPRQHDTAAEPNGGEPENAQPARPESTRNAVQPKPAQREPPDPIGTSESQPVVLPTREARNRTELADLPIGELAKRWRANPTWVAESSPQTRPELTEVALAWDTAVGLRPTPLGHAGRDPCTRALLELYADGVPKAALLRACDQAGRTDWICGRAPDYKQQMRKRRISTLNMGVFRDLLDAAPPIGVSRVSPAVAALLAERRKETA